MDVVSFLFGAVIITALGIFIIFNAVSIFKELSNRLKQKKSIKEDEKNDSN